MQKKNLQFTYCNNSLSTYILEKQHFYQTAQYKQKVTNY